MRLLWIFLPLLLHSAQITLSWLEDKPRSRAKDYYIWRFLDQNITPAQAQRAIEMAKNVNYKIFFRYAKRIKDPDIEHIASCLEMAPKELAKQDPSCVTAAITPYKMTRLDRRQRVEVFKKIQNRALKERLKYLLPDDPFKALKLQPKSYLDLFLSCGSGYRKKLDRYLQKEFLEGLAHSWKFKKMAKLAVLEDLPRLSYSLTLLDAKKLDAQSSFYIGLFAYKENLKNIARAFFQNAYKKAYMQRDKDRALFWLYKTTNDPAYLQKLTTSWDLDIYTLLAFELKEKPFVNYIHIPTFAKRSDINLSDPFVWFDILQKQEDPKLYKERFAYKNTMGAYANFLQKASHYRTHPFITPYEDFMDEKNLTKKATLYALARQESRFIPGSISRSFALGPMQFMPFLAKHYAKKQNISPFDLDMMFDERVSVSMAKSHIDYLYTHLKHPLFVAYAYNGGIGYTRRKVLPLFEKYEPSLAMELVSYDEAREYGKKVLSNYYIYRKIMQQPIRLQELLGLLKR